MATYHEEGRYLCRIREAVYSEASNANKTPQWVFRLDLYGQWDNASKDYVQFTPTARYPPSIYLSVTEKTMGTEELPGLARAGLEYLDFNGDFSDGAQFEGKEAIKVYCQHQEHNQKPGEYREQWNLDLPKKSNPVKQAERKVVRESNTLWGKQFKKKTGTKPAEIPGPKLATTEQPATNNGQPEEAETSKSGITEDEIPF